MRSPMYRWLFPGTRISGEKDAELEFMTTARGFRLATSVGGTLTGRGGNVIIIDDPMNLRTPIRSQPVTTSINGMAIHCCRGSTTKLTTPSSS